MCSLIELGLSLRERFDERKIPFERTDNVADLSQSNHINQIECKYTCTA